MGDWCSKADTEKHKETTAMVQMQITDSLNSGKKKSILA
jgi:hypothetical protein